MHVLQDSMWWGILKTFCFLMGSKQGLRKFDLTAWIYTRVCLSINMEVEEHEEKQGLGHGF
jgi:hypothetical protein